MKDIGLVSPEHLILSPTYLALLLINQIPTSLMTKFETVYGSFDTTRDPVGDGDIENKAIMHEEQQTEDDGAITEVYESVSDGDTSGVHLDPSSGDATTEETYEEDNTVDVSTTSTKDTCDEGITARTISYGPSSWARADVGPAAGELLVNDSFLDHSSGATLEDEHDTAEPKQGTSDASTGVDVSNKIPKVQTVGRETSAMDCIISIWDWRLRAGKVVGKDTKGNAKIYPEAGTVGLDIIQAGSSQTDPKGHTNNASNLKIIDEDQGNPDTNQDIQSGEGNLEQYFLPLGSLNTENHGYLGIGIDQTVSKDMSVIEEDSSPVVSRIPGCGEANFSLNLKNYRFLGERRLKRLVRNEERIARAEGRLRSVSGILLPAPCRN